MKNTHSPFEEQNDKWMRYDVLQRNLQVADIAFQNSNMSRAANIWNK